MAHGSWLEAHGPRVKARRSWLMAHSCRLLACRFCTYDEEAAIVIVNVIERLTHGQEKFGVTLDNRLINRLIVIN